jgi:hypothetical protein
MWHSMWSSQAGGLISGSTAVDASTLATMQSTLEAMDIGPLLSVSILQIVDRAAFVTISCRCMIFVIVYARMIEIYLMVSLAPIPFATFGNREQSMIGQNYLRSLFALGFQGFLIMICVAIYAVLIQSVAFSDPTSWDPFGTSWGTRYFWVSRSLRPDPLQRAFCMHTNEESRKEGMNINGKHTSRSRGTSRR